MITGERKISARVACPQLVDQEARESARGRKGRHRTCHSADLFNRSTEFLVEKKMLRVNVNVVRSCAAVSLVLASVAACAADANAPAAFVVGTNVLRTKDKVPPLGCLDSGGTRLIDYAANDIIQDSSCGEPIVWRDYCRAANCGANWFDVDWPGDNSLYGTCASGFFSGAKVRIYRVVNKDGNSLPEGGLTLDPPTPITSFWSARPASSPRATSSFQTVAGLSASSAWSTGIRRYRAITCIVWTIAARKTARRIGMPCPPCLPNRDPNKPPFESTLPTRLAPRRDKR